MHVWCVVFVLCVKGEGLLCNTLTLQNRQDLDFVNCYHGRAQHVAHSNELVLSLFPTFPTFPLDD